LETEGRDGENLDDTAKKGREVNASMEQSLSGLLNKRRDVENV
jgi:hypothetical protein